MTQNLLYPAVPCSPIHSKVMEHYTIYTRHQWHIFIIEVHYSYNSLQCGSSAKNQCHFSSSSTSHYKALWKPLCLAMQNSLFFPANQAIYTQNKKQFDELYEFWALLFVT